MENISEINGRIAKKLIYYRKAAGFTQAELAEKINYSDKSVSKWEQGNGVPDIYILMQLANIYGVTVDDIVGDGAPTPPKKRVGAMRMLIILLSSGIVWLVATLCFVLVKLFSVSAPAWLAFVYAIVVNSILLIVFAGIWHYRLLTFFSVSGLIWTAITSIYLTLRLVAISVGWDYGVYWFLFLLGIPLQLLEIFWESFRARFFKRGAAKRRAKKQKNAVNR